LETKLPAIRCRWCGVGHSDIMINPLTDIDTLCPYPKTDKDLLFCQKRKGGARNWEGYIRDPRDCRIYRIVHMPFNTASSNPNEKNKWWFARNLNYQKGLYTTQNFLPGGAAYVSGGLGNTSSFMDNTSATHITDTNAWRGYVYCPQNAGVGASTHIGQTAGEGTATTTRTPYTADVVSNHPGGPWNCEVYGALYSSSMYSKPDGNGKIEAFIPYSSTIPSRTFRGVCPIGWSIPSDQHWGVMLNAVDGCKTPTTVKTGDAIIGDTCGSFRIDDFRNGTTTNELLAISKAAVIPTANTINVEPSALNNFSHLVSSNHNDHFSSQYVGVRTGIRLKAAPTCPPGTKGCDNFANNANAIYGIYTNGEALGKASAIRTAYTRWMYAELENSGNDYYGFSVLPAGTITVSNGAVDGPSAPASVGRKSMGRGQVAVFATSTTYFTSYPETKVHPSRSLRRMFFYDKANVSRYSYWANGIFPQPVSVRCIKL
ncbi:MAG: hypothetical protein ACRCSB_05915, partial [Bacteroidales bacterium]